MSIQLNKFRNFLGANPIILVMKVALIGSFIWLITMFIPIIDFEIVQFTRLLQLFEALRNIITFVLVMGLSYLWLGLVKASVGMFSWAPYYEQSSLDQLGNQIYNNVIA
ncbi:MAG: hypothetical protein GF364_00695, partial [Candidatus Lokiarchaeota archaeon]|nr:hypothetical protein [Candidatus Lokiarchaeota archaeon]